MPYEILNQITSPVLQNSQMYFWLKLLVLFTSWKGNAIFHGTGKPLWACGSSCCGYALKRMSFWTILIRLQSLTATCGFSVVLGWSCNCIHTWKKRKKNHLSSPQPESLASSSIKNSTCHVGIHVTYQMLLRDCLVIFFCPWRLTVCYFYKVFIIFLNLK